MNQHYVPKVYLKQFENSQKKIYTLHNSPHRHSPYVKEINKTQVAYLPDFYTIKNKNSMWRLGVTNKDIIERNYNSRVENRFEKLIAKLLSPVQMLSLENAEEILLMFLSIKQRNPVFRRPFQNPQTILDSFNLRFDEVFKQRAMFEEILKREGRMNFDEFVEYGRSYIRELSDDPETPQNMHLEGIAKFHQNAETPIKEIVREFLSYKWFIFHAPYQHPFISSDNPGFCIDNNEMVHNLNFANASGFFFPLAPRLMLMITAHYIDRVSSIKNIHHCLAKSNLVEIFNRATFSVSYKKILSNNENTLRYVWHDMVKFMPHLNDTTLYKEKNLKEKSKS